MSMQEEIKIFCRNICRRREEASLSAGELSRRSGVPLEMLESLERNILPPEMDVGHALALAKVFGCQIYELFQ
mgnify:CR=1 FL=1